MTDVRARLRRIAEKTLSGVRAALPQLPAMPERRPHCGDCLLPILRALDWRGGDVDIAEAAPHLSADLDLTELRAALVNLGYVTTPRKTTIADLDLRFMPCLFAFAQSDEVCVVLGRIEAATFGFIGGVYRALTSEETALEGCAYVPSPLAASDQKDPLATGWIRAMTVRFKPYFAQLFIASLISNLLAITAPLFVMIVYDKVIGHHSLGSLPLLVVGILIAVGADFCLRLQRAELVARIAGRVDYLIGIAAFGKILKLPLAYTESPSVGSQIARLKAFESMRELFTGPALNALIDLPFVILILGAVAAISGPLVLIPIVTILAFVLLGAVGLIWTEPIEHDVGKAASERQDFLIDTAMQHQAIRREALEEIWSERFRTVSATSALLGSVQQGRSSVLEALAQLLVNLSALGMLVGGALAALHGALSVGALIAAMALTWRLLSPVRALFNTAARLARMRRSTLQLGQLFRMTDEFAAETPKLAKAPTRGEVMFSRVGLRYGNDSDPSLLNVSFRAAEGSLLAIVGPNGSGKSSVLKLVQGLYRPQAGRITIDGTDVRQIPTRALRRSVAYVPQSADLFYGTVAQNLRLADPLASDEALHEATIKVGIFDLIQKLPDGFDTRIGDTKTQALPRGFLRRLSIARALVRYTPILLLDEPEQTLDSAGDQCLLALLKALKGTRTIIMVSHRPSYIRLTDQAIFLRRGAVEYAGAPHAAISMLGLSPRIERAA
jgi:ATP-binding cassette subfamily C protein/ATP-binding cassette subfamily C protein LapB